MNQVSTAHIARRFGVNKVTVAAWRRRYNNFPDPVTTIPYPLYDMADIERWYADKWPDRGGSAVMIHRFRVSHDGVKLTSTTFGPMDEARGYLQGIRETMFADWRVFTTKEGFSAHRGNDIEVWVLDLTSDEPEPWYVYDSRFKATGRTK